MQATEGATDLLPLESKELSKTGSFQLLHSPMAQMNRLDEFQFFLGLLNF